RHLGRDRGDPAGGYGLDRIGRALAGQSHDGAARRLLPASPVARDALRTAVFSSRGPFAARVCVLHPRRRARDAGVPRCDGRDARAGTDLGHAVPPRPRVLGRASPSGGCVSEYDRLVRRASAAHVPLSVMFEVTHRCNLGCVHCYLTEGPVGRPRPNREELTLEEIQRVLGELAAAGTLFLTLSGGEVFLRRDALDIVATARELGFSVTVFTTGTLLTPDKARDLAALHPLSVEISVYSARAEVHDTVTRIPGSHARSLTALRLLREHGVTILIKTPLMAITSGEYRDLMALAESLGAGCGFDPMLVPRRD